MRLSGLQYPIAWEDRAATLATIQRLLTAEPPAPDSLLVLPEMALTGFSMDLTRAADSPIGESRQALCALAHHYRCWLVAGAASLSHDGRGLNQALVIDPTGTLIGRYTKMHPFSLTGEERHYAPGDEPIVIPCGPFHLAPFICYDLRFPEIFRSAARRGADLMVVVACWLEGRHAHWRPLLQARAIENQAWVVGLNRCGQDPSHRYLGGSVIFAPDGTLISELGTSEGLLQAELDPQTVARTRQAFPALRDLRPDWSHP